MKVQVEVDGKTQTVDVELAGLTLRESVEVQKEIGNADWDELVAGGAAASRPNVLLAIIKAKLRRQFPNLNADGFDVQFGDDTVTESDPT